MRQINYFDFIDGSLSRNILYALSCCNVDQIARLRRNQSVRTFKNDLVLSYRNLLFTGLDDYVEMTGFPLRVLLFGEEQKPATVYTEIDDVLIAALDSLTDAQLSALHEVAFLAFRTDLMASDDPSPSRRFLSVIKTRKKSLPAYPITDQIKSVLRTDVGVEISRYAEHYVPTFSFISDYWPDLANVAGISLRWILGVRRSTLFCQSVLADELFDMFTLMQSWDRRAFVGLVNRLCSDAYPELVDYYNRGREGI